MAILTTEQRNRNKQLPWLAESGCGMEAELVLKATKPMTVQANDILLMGQLPSRCKVIKMEVYSTALGSGTADVGLIQNGAMKQAFVEGVNLSAEAMTTTQKLGAFKFAPVEDVLEVGVVFKAGLTIPKDGEIRVLVKYRNAQPME